MHIPDAEFQDLICAALHANTLITDIRRNGNEGIGKPEPLKHGFQGYWSRRITDEHRLVCKVIDEQIGIAACRYHYER
jgi:toxin YoeB